MRGILTIAIVPILTGCYSSFPSADAQDTHPLDPAVDTLPFDTHHDPDVDPDLPEDPPWPDPIHDPGCTSITGGVCSIIEQCGCSPGFYCEFFADPRACALVEDCQAAHGTLPVESECMSMGQCMPGTACLIMVGDPVARCYEWCRDSSDCSIAGRECNIPVSFPIPYPCSSVVTAPYMVCSMI